MSAYIKAGDVDSRQCVADYQIKRVMQEVREYLEKESSSCSVYGSQTARLIALHLRAYADMVDEFACIIENVEEEERLEVQNAEMLRDKYHFQNTTFEEE